MAYKKKKGVRKGKRSRKAPRRSARLAAKVPRGINHTAMASAHKLCCGNVQHSRVPDEFSGTSLAVRGRTEFLVRPDQYGRLAFVFNPNSIKAPIITGPVYHQTPVPDLIKQYDDFIKTILDPNDGTTRVYPDRTAEEKLELPNPHEWMLGENNATQRTVASHTFPGIQNLADSYGHDVNLIGWGYNTHESAGVDKDLHIKRSQAFTQVQAFADKYRVTNARMVIRYIGNEESNQGIFTMKEFVPTGNVWGWVGGKNRFPTRIDSTCQKTTHMAAKDGAVYVPIVNSQKRNLKFLSIDDHEATLGTSIENADATKDGMNSYIHSHGLHPNNFEESFKQMAATEDLQETNLGMQSLLVLGNSLKSTGAPAAAQTIANHSSGDAAWHVEIVQDIEVTITTGSFQERMASDAPPYNPYYTAAAANHNQRLKDTGGNLQTHKEGSVNIEVERTRNTAPRTKVGRGFGKRVPIKEREVIDQIQKRKEAAEAKRQAQRDKVDEMRKQGSTLTRVVERPQSESSSAQTENGWHVDTNPLTPGQITRGWSEDYDPRFEGYGGYETGYPMGHRT